MPKKPKLQKFEVELYREIRHRATVIVEAESKEAAVDIAESVADEERAWGESSIIAGGSTRVKAL